MFSTWESSLPDVALLGRIAVTESPQPSDIAKMLECVSVPRIGHADFPRAVALFSKVARMDGDKAARKGRPYTGPFTA
jgi:hypothetical protein